MSARCWRGREVGQRLARRQGGDVPHRYSIAQLGRPRANFVAILVGQAPIPSVIRRRWRWWRWRRRWRRWRRRIVRYLRDGALCHMNHSHAEICGQVGRVSRHKIVGNRCGGGDAGQWANVGCHVDARGHDRKGDLVHRHAGKRRSECRFEGVLIKAGDITSKLECGGHDGTVVAAWRTRWHGR